MDAFPLDLPSPAGKWETNEFIDWSSMYMPLQQWQDAVGLADDRQFQRERLENQLMDLRGYHSKFAAPNAIQSKATAVATELARHEHAQRALQYADVLNIDRCMLSDTQELVNRTMIACQTRSCTASLHRNEMQARITSFEDRLQREANDLSVTVSRISNLRHAIAQERLQCEAERQQTQKYRKREQESLTSMLVFRELKSDMTQQLGQDRQCLWAAELVVIRSKLDECERTEKVYANLQASGLFTPEYRALQSVNHQRLAELRGLEAKCFVKIRKDAFSTPEQLREARTFRDFEDLRDLRDSTQNPAP